MGSHARVGLWVGLLLLSFLGTAYAEGEFRLQSLKGTVEVQPRGSRAWRELRAARRGSIRVSAGDLLHTGPNSSVCIVTSEGARFTLGANARVELRSPSRWRLLLGRVLAFLTGTRGVEVGTESAVAAARGTVFQVEVREDGTTTLTVVEGDVAFANELGSVAVSASQQSTARVGQPPTRPIVVDPSGAVAWEASLQTLLVPVEYPLVSSDPERLEQELTRREAALRARPDDPAAHAARAEVLLDLHRTEEALAEAEQVRRLAPTGAEAPGLEGYALLQAGRPDEAREQFAAAAAAAPDDARWEVGLGLVALAQRDPAPALPRLQRAVRLAPQQALPQAALAAAYLRVGDLEEASRAASRAVRLDPASSVANSYLAYVRLAEGDLGAAVTAGDRAVRAGPESALAHEAYGTALAYAGESAAADRELNRALALDPSSASAHLARAKGLAARGELEAALQEAEVAVSLDPQSAPAHSTLGLLFLLERDPRRAGRHFQQALGRSPTLSEAHTGWGRVLLAQGRFREAVEQQKVAVAFDTGSAAAENNLGGVYASLGQFPSAIEHLRAALRLQPEWGTPYANLAAVYLEQNRMREAVEAGERAVALGERSAFAHTVLARVYLRQGRVDRALSELRQAVAVDEDYPGARFQLARLYLDQGRSRDAVRELLLAVTRDPSAVTETRLYARTENTLAAGTDSRLHDDVRHSDQTDEGRLSYFLSGLLDQSNGFRGVNDRTSERFAEAIAGYQAEPTRQLVLLSTYLARAGGLPGPVTQDLAGDPDDHQEATAYDADLAYRQRWSRRVTSTVKYSFRHTDLDFRNPDSLLGGDRTPFRALHAKDSTYSPEVRVEAELGRRSSLRFGYASARDRLRDDGIASLFDPSTGGITSEPFALRGTPTTNTAWAEGVLRPSDRLHLRAGASWGRERGSSYVLSPRLVAVYWPDRTTWWSLTAVPIFRSDIAQLAPVEALADPKGLLPTNFAGNGYANSYELRWQHQGGRADTTTASLTYQQVHGLLLDVEDPALTGLPARVLLDNGSRWVADTAYERWLTNTVTGRLWARWQSSRGDFPDPGRPGREWPYVPRWQGGARLDYLTARGLHIGLEAAETGRRFADARNDRALGAHLLFSLLVELRTDPHRRYFVAVDNLTGRDFETFAGFPGAGRTFLAGLEYRY